MNKFRAWDNEKKVMNIVDGIKFDGDEVWEISFLGDCWRDASNYELMQSTGLTDKNGVEIFEGDIVKAWSEGYCGTFQVKWRNEGAPMYILYPAWQNEQFWNLHGNSIRVDDGIEIIGNIHQHPHLLT